MATIYQQIQQAKFLKLKNLITEKERTVFVVMEAAKGRDVI